MPLSAASPAKLEPSLTTRAVTGVIWTADTAFVHHCDAELLPLLVRHLRKTNKSSSGEWIIGMEGEAAMDR